MKTSCVLMAFQFIPGIRFGIKVNIFIDEANFEKGFTIKLN